MESKILGFGLRNTTLRIRSPLTIGIRNPVLGTQNPESTDVEFKIQDCLGIPGASMHNQEIKLWKLMK